MTDMAEKEGLKVPQLTEKTIKALEEFVPLEGSSSKNPLDLMEVVFVRDNFIKLITLLRHDPNIDALIFSMPLRFFFREMGHRGLTMFLDLMIEAKKLFGKPLLSILERELDPMIEGARQETEERFREAGIATFPTFQVAAKVLVNLKKYRDYLFLSD